MKEKLKAFFGRHDWLRKSVTIPVKLLLVLTAAVAVSVVTLSIARRVEPKFDRLLTAEKMAEPLDAVTAAIALESLRAHITATCKQSAPAVAKKRPVVNLSVPVHRKDDVR